eukprot:TRINITY_DN4935_c0_g1_i3.p1 TRINITY_DN4935_c0_g1~~TRINITY_DN4935_c0_g1_i3.p1  ORF type:complete len:426 (+),score=101.48 TRINITY_DN4935_c0_g1_i3:430-1707(+)
MEIDSIIRELASKEMFQIEDISTVATQRLVIVEVNRSLMMNSFVSIAKPDLKNPIPISPKAIKNEKLSSPKKEVDLSKNLEELLSKPSLKEMEIKKETVDLLKILDQPTVKERRALEKFTNKEGCAIKEYCPYNTKEECKKAGNSKTWCNKIHFRRILMPHTDISLGDCSYLDTCRHMKSCKFVHYEIDESDDKKLTLSQMTLTKELTEGQWVNCDIRHFDMSVLGKFSVIMADPPWDIHMNLPYGTMSDDEMRNLNIKNSMDDGYMFLWVTGRAMELGRECLQLWGYERVEEIVWVKTNQLQRIIRTGRTGHWLNHSKEHCLVGVKGNPQVNKFIDCDVLVAEVRETSRKPDEVYQMIERLSPGTRKLELFGRQHNVHPGWVTLGNQLDGNNIVEQDVLDKMKAKGMTDVLDLNKKKSKQQIKS